MAQSVALRLMQADVEALSQAGQAKLFEGLEHAVVHGWSSKKSNKDVGDRTRWLLGGETDKSFSAPSWCNEAAASATTFWAYSASGRIKGWSSSNGSSSFSS